MRNLRTVARWFMNCSCSLMIALSLSLSTSVNAGGLPGGEDSGHTKSKRPDIIQSHQFDFLGARTQEKERLSQRLLQEIEAQNGKKYSSKKK